MEEQVALVSRDGNGRMKLEYVDRGRKKIRLWETKNDKTLETTFGEEGSILIQRVVSLDTVTLNQRVIDSLKEADAKITQETAFTDIKLAKACPKCGEDKLARYVEAFSSKNEVPVMPIYYCSGCTTKSYYLTNDYLEFLIDNNRPMFSPEEVAELEKDKGKFMSELHAYIIRIFASQKVMWIK